VRLLRLGYVGDLSFEPFSAEVQRLARRELAAALVRSREYIATSA
jgi:predicted xylose isomerase-like sugar epimerase